MELKETQTEVSYFKMDEIKLELIRPTLYDIHKSFDYIKTRNYNGVKGEHHTRMVVFTNFVLGKKPVILTGQRSSGKSNIMMIVGTYCRNPMTITKSSDKADLRDVDLNEASHFIVPEINKVNDNFVEVMKDHGEGETTKYKTLDKWGRPKYYVIEPKPFISSLADENKNKLGDELLSRITTLPTDSSINQNRAVITEKLLRAQNPHKVRLVNQEMINNYQSYVKGLPDIKDLTFVYLPGKSIINSIPPIFTDSRRDTDKYLHNTYGITLFNHYDRMTFDSKKKRKGKIIKNIFVTPVDAWYNHIIFHGILIQSSLKCNFIESKILMILKQYAYSGTAEKSIALKDIHSSLIRNGLTPTIVTVKGYCENLYKNGYIIKHDELRPMRYEIAENLLSKLNFNLNWGDVVAECKGAISKFYPEYAEEYIKRFCEGEGLIATHPFTGEKVNILKHSEEEVTIHKRIKGLMDYVQEETEEEVVEVIDGSSVSGFFKKNGNGNREVDAMKFDEEFGEDKVSVLLKNGDITEHKPGKYLLLNGEVK